MKLAIFMIATMVGCASNDRDPQTRRAKVIAVVAPMSHMDNDVQTYSTIEILSTGERFVVLFDAGPIGDEFNVHATQCHWSYEGFNLPCWLIENPTDP